MAELMGQYMHTLDQKNRLFIPAKMRDILGEGFVLYFPQNGEKCLFGYTKEDWREAMDKFNEQTPAKSLTLRQRFIHKFATDVEVDKQGRFTIPTTFLENAGLKKEVFILGVGRRVEFWDTEEWARMEAQYEESEFAESFELAF